jgi:ABC-2 type transport system ATP-binding protein
LQSDSGAAHVFGIPVADADRSAEIRRRIGFVTEDKELYPYMTVEQIIRFTRPFLPKWRDDLERRYLEMFEIPPKRKIPDLSKRMRLKLMLLLAISRGAELLILDEPTDGLDPAATEDVLRELVAIAAASETTMFFSSHQLSDVERIADRNRNYQPGQEGSSGLLGRYESSVSAAPGGVRELRRTPSALGGRRRVGQAGRARRFDPGQPQHRCHRRAGAIPRTTVERFPVKRFSWNTRGATDMLWHKGWMETRFKLLFSLGFMGLLLVFLHSLSSSAKIAPSECSKTQTRPSW